MSNANLRISTLSVEPLYVSFRAENPITGSFDFSTSLADIALTLDQPVDTDWLVAVVEDGTWRAADGENYHVATTVVSGSSYNQGTYQIFLRIDDGTHTFVQRAGSVELY